MNNRRSFGCHKLKNQRVSLKKAGKEEEVWICRNRDWFHRFMT